MRRGKARFLLGGCGAAFETAAKVRLFSGASGVVSLLHMGFHELNAEAEGFLIQHRADKEKCENREDAHGGCADDFNAKDFNAFYRL